MTLRREVKTVSGETSPRHDYGLTVDDQTTTEKKKKKSGVSKSEGGDKGVRWGMGKHAKVEKETYDIEKF